MPWQSLLLGKSRPFPAHDAASGTCFQVVPNNSFLPSGCLSGESRAAPLLGVASAGGEGGRAALLARPGPGVCPAPLSFLRRGRPGAPLRSGYGAQVL